MRQTRTYSLISRGHALCGRLSKIIYDDGFGCYGCLFMSELPSQHSSIDGKQCHVSRREMMVIHKCTLLNAAPHVNNLITIHMFTMRRVRSNRFCLRNKIQQH